MSPNELISSLTSKSYQEINDILANESAETLLELLDGKSIKIGDTAASQLGRKNREDLVIDALLKGLILTAPGRVRATNILQMKGVKIPIALDAFRHLINDRSDGVVSNALFGIVFHRDRASIPLIAAAARHSKPESRRQKRYLEAINALEKDDPFLYSPGFHDAGDVWGLDKSLFGDRIG